MDARQKTPRHHSGFTLIEIVIAVAILSVALVTLLGLLSSATTQALQTTNKQRAMLMARRIMANVEVDLDVIKPTSMNESAEELLKEFGIEDPDDAARKRELSEVPLSANLEIKAWNVPGLPEDSLQRIWLRVYWSDNPADGVEVVYFVPVPKP